MQKKGMLYHLWLFCSLLKFFTLAISILNKFPDSIAKNEVDIRSNKISVKLCKINRNQPNGDKLLNSIAELINVGLLDMEECPDKNFHQLTFSTANIQKYFKTNRINHRIKTINKQLRLLVQDITN